MARHPSRGAQQNATRAPCSARWDGRTSDSARQSQARSGHREDVESGTTRVVCVVRLIIQAAHTAVTLRCRSLEDVPGGKCGKALWGVRLPLKPPVVGGHTNACIGKCGGHPAKLKRADT